MLTSQITQTLSVPNESVTVTIRKLSHHQLMKAQDARTDAAVAKFTQFAGILDKLPTNAEATQMADDPANKYDRDAVLAAGVTAWSYPVPVAEGLSDLDEDTAAWLFGEIIGMSVRSQAEGEASGSNSTPITA